MSGQADAGPLECAHQVPSHMVEVVVRDTESLVCLFHWPSVVFIRTVQRRRQEAGQLLFLPLHVHVGGKSP